MISETDINLTEESIKSDVIGPNLALVDPTEVIDRGQEVVLKAYNQLELSDGVRSPQPTSLLLSNQLGLSPELITTLEVIRTQAKNFLSSVDLPPFFGYDRLAKLTVEVAQKKLN